MVEQGRPSCPPPQPLSRNAVRLRDLCSYSSKHGDPHLHHSTLGDHTDLSRLPQRYAVSLHPLSFLDLEKTEAVLRFSNTGTSTKSSDGNQALKTCCVASYLLANGFLLLLNAALPIDVAPDHFVSAKWGGGGVQVTIQSITAEEKLFTERLEPNLEYFSFSFARDKDQQI